MAKEKRIGSFLVSEEILLAIFVGIAFCLVFCCVKQCHRKHSFESE